MLPDTGFPIYNAHTKVDVQRIDRMILADERLPVL